MCKALRWLIMAAAALSLAASIAPSFGFAAHAQTGDWRITQEVDRVTGAQITNVLLKSSKTLHSGLALTPAALLQFVCLKGQPLVHLQFAFKVGSKGDSDVAYRFDNKPAHPVEPRILRGLKIMLIEDQREVAQFLDGLATAKVLYLTINSLAKGRTSAEFRVAGAPAAIEAASAACPAKPKR